LAVASRERLGPSVLDLACHHVRAHHAAPLETHWILRGLLFDHESVAIRAPSHRHEAPVNPQVQLSDIALVVSGCAIAAGLIMRGRWRLSLSFAGYIALGLTGHLLVLVSPELFFTGPFWMVVQSGFDILKLGIALEAGWWTFRAFPGAASVARKTGLLILALTAVAANAVPLVSPNSSSFETALVSFHPRVSDGAIWLMAAILAIAHWYRVPVHRFHAALLTSLAVYLAFFTWLLRLFAGRDFDAVRGYVNALDPAVFLLLSCWWAHIAWRAENTADRARMNTLRELRLRMSSRDDDIGFGVGAVNSARSE